MLIRQTLQYLPAQLLGPLAQLAAIMMWTHWLPPEAFGAFTLALATQEVVYLALLSCWSYYLLRFLPGADAPLRARMDAIEAWLFVCNVVLQAGVLAGLMCYIDGTWPSADRLAVSFAFTLSRSYCAHLAERLRSSGDILRYSLLQIVGPVGGLVAGLTWAQYDTLGLREVLLSYALAQALSLLLAWPGADMRPHLARVDGALARHALHYGMPLALSGLLAWVPGNGIRFVVEREMGLAAVGMFSVGWTLGQRGCAFAATLVTAASFPLVLRLEAAGQPREALRQLSLNGALLCAVLLPTTAGLLLLTPSLAQLAISPAYVPATLTILPLAALAGTVKNLRIHFANQAFLLAEKTSWTLALDIVEAVLFLAAVAAGLQVVGLAGAAWGALLAAVVGALLAFGLAVVRLQMPFPSDHLWRVALATGMMAAALWALPTPSDWAALARTVLLGAGLYAMVLAACYPRQIAALRRRASP